MSRNTKTVKRQRVPKSTAQLEHLREDLQRRIMALAGAAHEIKTPLTIVSGYIELLLSEKQGPLNEAQRRALSDSRNNCTRLQRCVDSFLTYTRLDTGRFSLKLDPGDLQACLSEVTEFWLSQFQTKGVPLYLLCSEKLPVCRFDYFKVQEIVSSMLDNALKYTPKGGSVWVAAEPFLWDRRSRSSGPSPHDRRVTSGETANAIRVTVADTGIGIPSEYLTEIFDDFFRVPGAEAQAKGTGLGLAIARRLVRAHGGKIWAQSELGAGTSIFFLLPLNAEQGATQGEAV